MVGLASGIQAGIGLGQQIRQGIDRRKAAGLQDKRRELEAAQAQLPLLYNTAQRVGLLGTPEAQLSALTQEREAYLSAGQPTNVIDQGIELLQSGDHGAFNESLAKIMEAGRSLDGSRVLGSGDNIVKKVGTNPETGEPILRNFKVITTAGGKVTETPIGGTFEGQENNPLASAYAARKYAEAAAGVTGKESGLGETSAERSEREAREKQIALAVEKGNEMLDKSETFNAQTLALSNIIKSIDKGATVGKISGLFPSFEQATLEFEQAAKELGLGVISSTTFGALSAPELELAMKVGFPDFKNAKEARDYAVRKKAAIEKLQIELENAADFFDGTKTRTDWMRLQRQIRKQRKEAEKNGGGTTPPPTATQTTQTAAPSPTAQGVNIDAMSLDQLRQLERQLSGGQ
jgi:hypothetical protein